MDSPTVPFSQNRFEIVTVYQWLGVWWMPVDMSSPTQHWSPVVRNLHTTPSITVTPRNWPLSISNWMHFVVDPLSGCKLSYWPGLYRPRHSGFTRLLALMFRWLSYQQRPATNILHSLWWILQSYGPAEYFIGAIYSHHQPLRRKWARAWSSCWPFHTMVWGFIHWGKQQDKMIIDFRTKPTPHS